MAFSGLGSGTVSDPYQITTWSQFKEIKNELTAYYIIKNDIVASDAFGIPVSFFTGVLNGNNCSVSAIPSNGSSNALLFGCTGATIKNIKLSSTQSYAYFGPTSSTVYTTNSTFENIELSAPNINSVIRFCNHMDNCTLKNLVIKGKDAVYISTNITNSTLDNLLIQSYKEIIIGGGTNSLCNLNVFLNCKFVVVYKNKSTSTSNTGGTRFYRPKNCTFTGCLFYGSLPYSVESYSILPEEKSTYTRVSFISNYRGPIENTEYFIGGIDGDMYNCFFGGSKTYTSGANSYNYLISSERNFSATDCHIELSLYKNYEGALLYPKLSFIGATSAVRRIFCNYQAEGFTTAPTGAFTNGTDCYINRSRINEALVNTGNYTKLTEAQITHSGNFINFDFINNWEIAEGISSPRLKNVIYDATPYLPENLLSSINISQIDLMHEKVQVNTLFFPLQNTLKCYVSKSIVNIESPENLVPLDFVSDLLSEKTIEMGEGQFYVFVVYELNGKRETLTAESYHYSLEQKSTTIVNVVSPNYITLNETGNILGNTHGSIFLDGYIFGSSRDGSSATKSSLVKLKADDYSIRIYKKIYLNKNAQTGQVLFLEQIVQCNGFLWCQGSDATYKQYLIRINPSDLDYIIFNLNDQAAYSAPIGADDRYLYISPRQGHYNHHKIDSNLLIGSFASYSYTGNSAVALPLTSIVGTYNSTTQGNYIDNPKEGYTAYFKGEIHSILIDMDFIYLMFSTQSGLGDGYHPTYGNVAELHKVNKHTMTAAGYCMIPRATDDAVQNATHIFAGVEFSTWTNPEALGFNSCIYAVRKSDLKLLMLSTLHKDFNTPQLRASYGIHYFGNYIVTQLINLKKSVVINITDVDNWSLDYPRGLATESIFQIQKDGVVTTNPPNEMQMDSSGIFHASTWLEPTVFFKFNPIQTGVALEKKPIIQTSLKSNNDNSLVIGGYVIDQGLSKITSGGFKYGNDPDNLINDIAVNPFKYEFQAILNSLSAGIYYFKAYGINQEGVFYGNTVIYSNINALILSYTNATAMLTFLNSHSGCSIRCVQDAPGVANGTLGTTQDQDGNIYDTVVINGKRWMVQNLKTTKYRNGEYIPIITDAEAWEMDENGGYCAYENNIKNI